MKRVLVMGLVFAMLVVGCGFAEEVAGAPVSGESAPLEQAGIPGDVALADEGADQGAAEVAAPSELAILLMNPTSSVLDYAQSVTLSASLPAGVGEASWSSSDENVAAINANGDGSVTVVGVGEGTATITCAFGDQSRTYSVTVNPPRTLQIMDVEYPSVLMVSDRGWKLGRGAVASKDDLRTLTSTIRNAQGETVGNSYTQTFDAGVKRYEIRGIDRYVPFSMLRADEMYTWMLTATDASGRSVSVNLPIRTSSVEETVVSRNPGGYAPIITLPDGTSGGALELQIGETKRLTATQLSGATGNDLIWMSYDPAVAAISPNGEITGIGAGSTMVICRTVDNTGSSAACAVTVRAPAPAPEAEANDAAASTNPQGEATPVPQDGRNYLVGTATPKSMDFNTLETTNNFQTYEPYSTPGKRKLGEMGFEINDQVTISFDWEISQNESLPFVYGNFRTEWAGWKDGKDGLFIAGIMSPVATFSQGTTKGHAQMTVTLTDAILQAHTLRLRVDNSVLKLTISNCKLERGGVPTGWTPAPEDAAS